MSCFGFHWCHEETLALFAALPFLGLARIWIRDRWHRLIGKTPACGKPEHTCHEHEEDEKPLDTDGGL